MACRSSMTARSEPHSSDGRNQNRKMICARIVTSEMRSVSMVSKRDSLPTCRPKIGAPVPRRNRRERAKARASGKSRDYGNRDRYRRSRCSRSSSQSADQRDPQRPRDPRTRQEARCDIGSRCRRRCAERARSDGNVRIDVVPSRNRPDSEFENVEREIFLRTENADHQRLGFIGLEVACSEPASE